MKVSVLRSAVIAVAMVMAGAAYAEEAPAGPKFELHGFVGASFYGEDAAFNGFGGAAWFVKGMPRQDKLQLSADVRQTRLNFSLAGAKIWDATPKAVVEVDFYGGNQGPGTATGTPGGFSDVSVLPRLRLGYAELAWANTVIRVGQDHELILGGPLTPATVGHVANPIAYQAGLIGWRYPGIGVFQNIPIGDMKLEAAVQITRAPGRATELDGGTGLTYGESSGLPAFEGRLRLKAKILEAFVAFHWSRIDRNGIDNTGPVVSGTYDFGQDQEVIAAVAGLKLTIGPVTLQGSGFTGKNTGPILGNMNQFVGRSANDVHEWGLWGQLGFNITSEFSAWAFAGVDHPDQYEEAKAFKTGTTPAALQNVVFSGMLRYMLKGYAIGLEYTHWRTKYSTPIPTGTGTTVPLAASTASVAPDGNLDGNQLMLSAFYFF